MSSYSKRLLLKILQFYRDCLSPILTFFIGCFGFVTHCRFPETCSQFAERELKENQSVGRALGRIFRRLMSCGPWRSSDILRERRN